MFRYLVVISKCFYILLRVIMFLLFIFICMLIFGDLDFLLSCFSFVVWIFLGCIFLLFLVLRWKRLYEYRFYKVWIGIFIVMVMILCYFIIVFLFVKF